MQIVKIYGKKNCEYCESAKRLAMHAGIPFEFHDVESDIDARRFFIVRSKGALQVPQIFAGPDHIGGYTEFANAITSGDLNKYKEISA